MIKLKKKSNFINYFKELLNEWVPNLTDKKVERW